MYAPAIRTEPRLAKQNVQPSWADCTLRRRPRPHRWTLQQVLDGRLYWRCTRCPVVTYTPQDRPGDHTPAPDPWLGRRPSVFRLVELEGRAEDA